MYFEYPYLLWLLIVPALLAVKYVYDELRDRRPHFRVSVRAPWMAGGSTVLDKVRHIPLIFRIAICPAYRINSDTSAIIRSNLHSSA